jgi:hypothetical protein
VTGIYARWHMFEEKREAVMAIEAALLPRMRTNRFSRLDEYRSVLRLGRIEWQRQPLPRRPPQRCIDLAFSKLRRWH